MSDMRKLYQIGAVMLALLVVASGVGAAASSSINTSADAAHNPTVEVDVTKSVHQMGWAATEYEDDNGDLSTLDAEVNESANNSYSFVASDINFTDAGAFPHEKSEVSALDATEYTKTGANSAKLSVSDVETAPGVDAVRVNTDGSMASGDVAAAEFSNFSVTSDESKRMLQLGLDISTLDSATVVEARVIDEDGDYKVAEINSSRSSGEDWIAGATGEGYVYQQKLGDLTTQTSGDGTFDNIQTVQFRVLDGDADVSVMAVNTEKMSKWKLGEEKIDSDGDGELETETIEEVKSAGAISIHSLDSMGSTFDSATIKGLTIPMQFGAEHLTEEQDISFEKAEASNYPSFDWRVDVYYRLSLPSAYDLSYSNAVLTDTVEVPGNRYQTVEYAEGIGDAEFGDISFSNDFTSQYGSQDADLTLDSTIQAGQELALHYDYVVTDGELSEMEQTGGGAPMSQSSGGPISWIVGAVMGLLGLLGIKSRGS